MILCNLLCISLKIFNLQYNVSILIFIFNKMTKRPLRGTNRKSVAVSGFRARMKRKEGRKVINNRRKKRRKLLSI